jgi:transmembrane sensor
MEKFPIDKIIASFENKLSNEDQANLDLWLNATKEHQTHYTELKKVYSSSKKIKTDFVVNRQAALEKVNRRLVVQRMIRLTQRVAAAILFVFMVTQIWYRVTPVSDKWQQISAENKQVVFLADSSKVILAPHASLQYPKSFNHKNRKVVLTGEAYFEVTHDKNHPFIVQTKQTRVKVLGTRFLVNATDAEKEEVTVDEGKVAFRSLKKWSQTPVFLTKNERGTWSAKTNDLTEQINIENNTNAWLSNRLTFTNTPIKSVVKDVSVLYDVQIELGDMLSPSLKYTGNFNNANIETVMNILSLSLNVSVKKENDKYIIMP